MPCTHPVSPSNLLGSSLLLQSRLSRTFTIDKGHIRQSKQQQPQSQAQHILYPTNQGLVLFMVL